MPGMMRRNMQAGPPEKADFGAIKKLLAYCKRYFAAFIIAILFAVVSSVFTIIGPEKIGDLTDEIKKGMISEIDMDAIKKIGTFLIVIYSLGAVLGYAQQFITATVTQYTSKRLRRDISQKINRLPLNYFDTTSKGDILSRVTNDVDTIGQTLSSSTANLISALVLFFGVLLKMFTNNALLALVTIVSSIAGFFFMGFIMKKSQKYFNKKQSALGEMNGHIEEIYTNHNIVYAFGAKKRETEKFHKINEVLYESNWKSHFLSGLMGPIMNFSGNLAYVLIFIVGTSCILNGSNSVTLGTITSFMIYAKLFSQPLQTLSQSMTSIQQASAASKRVFEILGEKEMEDETAKTAVIENVRGDVEFKNVKFGYSADKTIIHNFSQKLKAGQKIAIVGPTGAGKTTMVNLLMRFYDVDEGDILIDGISTSALKRENVHDLFDMILQDTWLFDGTIRENLIYNNTDIPDEKLDTAVEAVGLNHFIASLPEGYDTPLNDSLNLSEGQKQQLTIARAMIKDSPMLILDEATSSVDTRTELIIQEAMDKLTSDRTSFVIAHRLSTIKNADIILVMKDGDIIEQGNHESLIADNGFYAELYNSQFVTT